MKRQQLLCSVGLGMLTGAAASLLVGLCWGPKMGLVSALAAIVILLMGVKYGRV